MIRCGSGLSSSVRVGKLTMIDLAGSERASGTKVRSRLLGCVDCLLAPCWECDRLCALAFLAFGVAPGRSAFVASIADLCPVLISLYVDRLPTQNRGSVMLEGAKINRSLLALGNCINALAKQSRCGL